LPGGRIGDILNVRTGSGRERLGMARSSEREGLPPSDKDRLRAADDDRRHVAELLRGALDEGRLTLGEYDERLAIVYAARTYGELNAVLDDLPTTGAGTVMIVPPAQLKARGASSRRRIPLALMILWTVWGSIVVVNLVVWVLVMFAADGDVYPWPVWIIGPPGAALLATTIGVQAIRRARE